MWARSARPARRRAAPVFILFGGLLVREEAGGDDGGAKTGGRAHIDLSRRKPHGFWRLRELEKIGRRKFGVLEEVCVSRILEEFGNEFMR